MQPPTPIGAPLGCFTMSEHELGALLRAHGYEVALRDQGWHECLLSRASERWIGRGLTPLAALEDALAQMLPSALARAVLVAPRA